MSNVKLVSNKKDYLKRKLEPRYKWHKIFGNNLCQIRKSKLALKLNKPGYNGICILELNHVLMYELRMLF